MALLDEASKALRAELELDQGGVLGLLLVPLGP